MYLWENFFFSSQLYGTRSIFLSFLHFFLLPKHKIHIHRMKLAPQLHAVGHFVLKSRIQTLVRSAHAVFSFYHSARWPSPLRLSSSRAVGWQLLNMLQLIIIDTKNTTFSLPLFPSLAEVNFIHFSIPNNDFHESLRRRHLLITWTLALSGAFANKLRKRRKSGLQRASNGENRSILSRRVATQRPESSMNSKEAPHQPLQTILFSFWLQNIHSSRRCSLTTSSKETNRCQTTPLVTLSFTAKRPNRFRSNRNSHLSD